MKRKMLAMLLTGMMAASLLAGCGNTAQETASETAPEEEAAAEETETQEEPAGEAEEATAGGAGKSAYGDVTAKENYNLYVIVKSMSSDFWRAAADGAEDEAQALGVTVTVIGPSSNTDIADQVQMLNNAVNSKPDGIGIAASDKEAVMDSLQAAKDMGIPVICFNSGVPNAPEGSVYATASTNNYNAGGIAAENMYAALKDTIASADAPVRIGVVNQDVTSESVIDRGLGFIDKMMELVKADGKSAAVIGSDKYVADAAESGDESTADVIIEVKVPAQATSELCAIEAGVLLNEQDLIGIMGTNQETAEGIITADDLLGKIGTDPAAGEIIACGFDSGATIIGAIEGGRMYGAVTQSPRYQGQITVDLLTMIANGEEVQDEETPAFWYNKENMNDPEIAPNLIK